MKKFSLSIQISILLLFLNACDIVDDDNYGTMTPLDSKIKFKVVESYEDYQSTSVPEIFIDMVTEKEYPCCNYGISTYSRFENRKVIVDIKGIYKPDICLTAFGPANTRVKLGYLKGVYEIELNGDSFTDNYNLLISDSLIILDGNGSAKTEPAAYFIYRYPHNSFAYAWSRGVPDSLFCLGFIDTLKSVISLNEFTFSNVAEIPYFQKPSQYESVSYYYYENESDFNKISSVMKSYKQAHFPNDEVYVSIYSWKNKRILSWTL
jgi:hypothetical protein